MFSALLSLGASLLGASAQRKSANRASSAQVQAAQLGVDEQQRQFDAMREMLQPYIDGGADSLAAQLSLAGANGSDAEQQAIDAILNGPTYQAMVDQGEDGILANASATGGLRGGDVQGALGQFRPQMMTQMINDRFSKLGGLAGLGQASAAGVGAAGINTGQNIAGAYTQMGQAQAGNHLAQGQANADMFGAFSQFGGTIQGLSKDGQWGKGVFF